MGGQYWIWAVPNENWEIAKSKQIWAVRSKSICNKVKKDDVVIFYVKNTGYIKGIFSIASDWFPATEKIWADEIRENKLIYPYQIKIQPIKLGDVNFKGIINKLSFVGNKSRYSVYLRASTWGGPSNFGKPISEADYKVIFEGMQEIYQVKKPSKVIVSGTKEEIKPSLLPNHNKIRDMICEIGKLEGKVSETEYPVDNKRLDVIWKRRGRTGPDVAFEVHISGDFYKALTILKEAWDLWGSNVVLVTTDEYEDEARRWLGKAFHEMEDKARIINWVKIKKLYELEKEMKILKDEIGI